MSVRVCQRAFCCQPGEPVSAPADSQAPSANCSETCAEWNWRRSRKKHGWRLPTTGANWSTIPDGKPALRRRQWWEMTIRRLKTPGNKKPVLHDSCNCSTQWASTWQKSVFAQRAALWCLQDCEIFRSEYVPPVKLLHWRPSFALKWKQE